MICLDKIELERLYEYAKKTELLNGISTKGYTAEELKIDNKKKHEIVDVVVNKGLKDKDEVEIFAALFCYLDFYPKGSKICFALKDDFTLSRDAIYSLQDLKNAVKEYELTDFGIFSNDGLRQFQLKRYRESLDTNSIFEFIKDKIAHYSNNLGDINLLIVLQTRGGDISGIDFHMLNKKLNSYSFKSQSEILISYNEENKFNVINRVYPRLATCRIPLKLPSS